MCSNLRIDFTSPNSRGDHGVTESHGSRLKDVCNLRVDCRIVPSPIEVGTVAFVHCIGDLLSIWESARKEDGQPLIVDDVLVGGNGELTCTVEQPLILLILVNIVRRVVVELSGPPLMHTVPQDTHGQKEGVLVTTRITNSCINKFKISQIRCIKHL